MKATVHIVDDDSDVRASLSMLLRAAGHATEIYEDGGELLARPPRSGCVLLDLRMPAPDGLEVLIRLRAGGFGGPVIMLTAFGDIANAVAAMKAGATDFLEKPCRPDALTAVIEGALAASRGDALAGVRATRAREKLGVLSGRECDVLRGLVSGLPNKLIAHTLAISPRTVEIYRANMMDKLGVKSLSDALRLAFLAGVEGLVEEGDAGPIAAAG